MKYGAPKLTISIDVELAPDLREYTNFGQEMPTEREIIVRKQVLKHKFVTNNPNIQKCNICMECHTEKDVMMNQDSYTCKKCKDRHNPNHFI
jgi:formylmethanofuran dehydrogenase subunit E